MENISNAINMSFRVDKGLKKQADELFRNLGMNTSVAINMFLTQCVREQQIPFTISMQSKEPSKQLKEALKELLNGLKEGIETANLYSSDWFAKATDAELNLEREKVRLAYCASGDNFSEAGRLQNLLWRFDKEMSKRAWGDEIPHAPSTHREHGWYLPNYD